MKYMKVTDIAQKYKVTRQAVYYWIKKGMPAHNFENMNGSFFLEDEVEKWVHKYKGVE